MKIAVFCVGNRLMLDDGIGPAVYDELVEHYEIPEGVDLYDLGCMTMKLLNKVDEYDFILTVDAVDGTDSEPGTVFRYKPEDIARTQDADGIASRAQARRPLRCGATARLFMRWHLLRHADREHVACRAGGRAHPKGV